MNNRQNRCRRCEAPIRPTALDAEPNVPLAMVYIKNQEFGRILEPQKALTAGTVFPELCKPFLGAGRGGFQRRGML